MSETDPRQPEGPASNRPPQVTSERPALPVWAAWGLIVGLGMAIWLWDVWLDRRPSEIEPWGWRLLAIFLPTVLALMLRPIAGGAVVLLALAATVLLALQREESGALQIKKVLAGYTHTAVWLVLAAYFISRALIKTGLARRVALTFVRLMGHNTLGLSYAMLASDTVLAGMIPSNSARVGGVLVPITRSLAELYQSYPGRTAGLLGSFLMLTLYQGDVVACALFVTGQASNWLAANEGAKFLPDGPGLNYATWFLHALAPAVTCLLVIPWLVYRLNRPTITRTPAAAEFARTELVRMGRPGFAEIVVMLVIIGVCTLWIMDKKGENTAIIALCGAGVLLLTGVLAWEDAISERSAWDVFIWYGGLVQMGELLHEAKLTKYFAESLAAALIDWSLVPLFLVTLLIYFYAHYAFASITTHILSMYPAFVGVLIAAGAPPALVVFCFAYFANFSAGLTHYGTTPAPIIFSLGYVPQRTWWRVGFLLSLFNVTVWLTVGMAWWKILGLW